MLIFNEIHKKEAKFTWIYAILNLRALSEIESHQEPGGNGGGGGRMNWEAGIDIYTLIGIK